MEQGGMRMEMKKLSISLGMRDLEWAVRTGLDQRTWQSQPGTAGRGWVRPGSLGGVRHGLVWHVVET